MMMPSYFSFKITLKVQIEKVFFKQKQ